jgi:hypothetical protein
MKEIKQLKDHFINEDGEIFILKNFKTSRYMWIIKEPNGEIIETESLIKFCSNNNLTLGLLKRTFKGVRSNHKGYSIINRKPLSHQLSKINTRYKIDYLMATNFNIIENTHELLIIHHLDGNPSNNGLSNLIAISPLLKEEKALFLNDANCYVTNLGRVFVLSKYKGWYEPKRNTNEYIRVSFNNKVWLLHRLIAMAFINNPNNHETINHINEIKTDNRIENLEWCTLKQNLNHSRYRMGRNRSLYRIINIKTEEIFQATNLNYFCEENNLTPKLLRHTLTRNKKHHKGFKILERIECTDKNSNHLHLFDENK